MKSQVQLTALILVLAATCQAAPQIPDVGSRSRFQLRKPKTTTTTKAPRPLTIIEKIEVANKNVSAPSAMYEDFRMTIGSSFNWEQLLSPAPLGISVLGDLMVVASSMSDFPLNEIQPEGGYAFMKYPGSFRASLVQISNSGYQAFMRAHTNMDQIRLYALNVPLYMKDATRILVSKNTKLIVKLLPVPLMRIQEAAERSVTLSLQVVDSFDLVMNLTDEVLSAVTATKGLKEQQLDDTRKEQEVLTVVVTNTATMLEEMKRDKENLEKTVEETQNDIREAMRKMPSGWKIIGMNLLDSFKDVVTLRLDRVINGGSMGGGTYRPSTPSADVSEKVNLDEECLLKNRQNVLKIVGIATRLVKFAARDFGNDNSTMKSQYNAANDISRLTTIAEDALGCEMVEKICQAGIEVMGTLEELLKSQMFNDTEVVTGKIQNFSEEAEELKKTVHSMGNPVSGRTPSMSNDLPTSGRASDIAVANVRFQVANAQERLKMARESADKARDRMVEINREYIQALTQMQRMNFSEIRYEEAIKLLQEGLATLGKLKEHWSGLVRYFKAVSNIVEVVMSKSLIDFRSYISETSTDLDLLESEITLDIIYDSAMKASQASYFVHSMADTYTKVSAKYIMPNIAKLDQMIAFDAKTAGMSIDQKRRELLESCTRDSEEIITLVMAEKNALITQIEDRMKSVSDQYAFLFSTNELGNLESENYIVDEFA